MTETSFEDYGIPVDVAKAYDESLKKHIAFVQEAGKQLHVPQAQLDRHDKSKYSALEFPGYALHFHGGGAPDRFASSWLHHIHHNPHHWQHWIFPDGHTPKGSTVENGVVKMPEEFALEMVADWMGASKAYTGSWDMRDWLRDHAPRIRVHHETKVFLSGKLFYMGYDHMADPMVFGSSL